MQDLGLSQIIFISIGVGISFFLYFRIRLWGLKKIKNRFTQEIKKIRTQERPYYFSSFYSKNITLKDFFHQKPTPEEIIYKQITQSIKKGEEATLRAIKQSPKNLQLLLLYGDICKELNKRIEFTQTLNNLKLPFYVSRALRANFLRLDALNDIYQTDMYNASKKLSKALKIYQKEGFTYEEAECYMSLGQTYRISGVFDVAYTMFHEAEKLYTTLEIEGKKAEAIAYQGLVEISRENYNTAEEYFIQAEEICNTHDLRKTESDIKNWHGLNLYLQKRHNDAQKLFNSIIDKKEPSDEALAFSSEMLSRITFHNKQFEKSLSYADKALIIYQKTHHQAGIFENLYLKAEIYYATEEYQKSSEILTTLIQNKTSNYTTFYPANAYSLLGLIELHQNNLRMARTLFKQAIDLENSKNRLKGAAIDYNNLAEICFREGDKDNAKKYLQQALKYAEELEDTELKEYLQSKL